MRFLGHFDAWSRTSQEKAPPYICRQYQLKPKVMEVSSNDNTEPKTLEGDKQGVEIMFDGGTKRTKEMGGRGGVVFSQIPDSDSH